MRHGRTRPESEPPSPRQGRPIVHDLAHAQAEVVRLAVEPARACGVDAPVGRVTQATLECAAKPGPADRDMAARTTIREDEPGPPGRLVATAPTA